jgi:hypothetical protein
MSDRFYESDTDLEAIESDDEMAELMSGIESLDDEDFNPLDPLGIVTGGLNAVGNVLGGLGGAARGAAGGFRSPRPNVQRYPTRLPTPSQGIPNPALSRQFATQSQVQALAKQVAANRASIATVNKRAEVINNRVNTTEKKLSSEVARLNAVNATQGQAIARQGGQIKTLREDLEKSTQSTLLMTLLTSGAKEFEITAPAKGTPVGGGDKVTLKPSGGSLDLLLPLLLMGGMGGSGKGGMFDNPLILFFLMDSFNK